MNRAAQRAGLTGLILIGSGSAVGAPDAAVCQLFNLSQFSADGSVRGLAGASTLWNIGDADLRSSPNPSPMHPFESQSLYRLKNDRFEQIGVGWVRHGYFALGSLQCDLPDLPNCVFEPGHAVGEYLGQGCTDTNSASLHATGLGPRFEIDPWTGAFDFSTSLLSVGGLPGDDKRQVRVESSDLHPAQNAGAQYFFETRYIHASDRSHLNSVAWKPCTPVAVGSNFVFTQSGASTMPNWGNALDAWPGAAQTVVAEQVPVVEGVSPDGRSILAYKVTDNGDGTWHYEYALLNIDMDRQIDEFAVPVSTGVAISNIQFRAPAHTEPFAWVGGPAIDNTPWSPVVSSDRVRWSTATNPLRWGMLLNFAFDAAAPPAAASATIGLFRPIAGRPDELPATTQGPSGLTPVCTGDVSGRGGVPDGHVDVDDLNALLSVFGTEVGQGSPADLAHDDGFVDVDDLNVVLGHWGDAC
ncbi:MAG: hypothetical protein H6812_04230 [Phycisphaeraceae bacterium]|nr:hypothetical protein [Phycisphaerales bacterium]MCB9842445.1 hypothetical protein [Phycisphaeraceae bacterium]